MLSPTAVSSSSVTGIPDLIVPQSLIRETHWLPCLYLILPKKTLSQPFGRMLIYCRICRTDLTQAEMVRPAGQHPVDTTDCTTQSHNSNLVSSQSLALPVISARGCSTRISYKTQLMSSQQWEDPLHLFNSFFNTEVTGFGCHRPVFDLYELQIFLEFGQNVKVKWIFEWALVKSHHERRCVKVAAVRQMYITWITKYSTLFR